MGATDATHKKNAESKAKFLKLYRQKLCNITATCEANNNMARSTFYQWREKDKDFDEKCIEIEESLLDFAESQLLKNIKDGKETSLIFFLKCKGKKRGYIDKYELEHSGDVGIKIDVAWGNDDKKIDKD